MVITSSSLTAWDIPEIKAVFNPEIKLDLASKRQLLSDATPSSLSKGISKKDKDKRVQVIKHTTLDCFDYIQGRERSMAFSGPQWFFMGLMSIKGKKPLDSHSTPNKTGDIEDLMAITSLNITPSRLGDLMNGSSADQRLFRVCLSERISSDSTFSEWESAIGSCAVLSSLGTFSSCEEVYDKAWLKYSPVSDTDKYLKHYEILR
jgi:hypothetical protein